MTKKVAAGSDTPALAWRDPVTSGERARELLGAEWYDQLQVLLDLVRYDTLPRALAGETLKALTRAAERFERVRPEVQLAVLAAVDARFPVAGVVSRDELAELYESSRALLLLAGRIADRSRELANRARQALRSHPPPEPVHRPGRRQVSAEEEARGVPRSATILEVPPALFVAELLRNFPGAPIQDTAAWAYFAIGHRLCEPPADGAAWDQLRTQWRTVLRRANTAAARHPGGKRAARKRISLSSRGRR